MNWIWVFIGGGTGALCRWGVSLLNPSSSVGFPVNTTIVNLLGCLLIGIAAAALVGTNQKLQLFLMLGFLGGFTTFSSFGLEIFRLIEQHQWQTAVIYILISNLVGVALVVVGYKLTNLCLT
ncbi:MAG: fluoride efflux transporter CrcB [Bacteroidia bacterium]